MNVLRSLSHRPFALLWTGQTISRLGDSLYRIALAWWVLEKTGSASAMGTVLVFSQIPLLIFLLIGGIVVDRFPRLRIMFVSDLLCGIVVTFIAIFSCQFDLRVCRGIFLPGVSICRSPNHANGDVDQRQFLEWIERTSDRDPRTDLRC
jgi:MFS family permease